MAEGGAIITPAPAYATIPAAIDVERTAFIEIQDRLSREVVTVIELLSPSNKTSDREQYLGKRLAFLRSSASFVELDLLRGGARMPLDELPKCDYYAMVSRPLDRPRLGIWPIHLRSSLPKIPIPLRVPHPDAKLNLRGVFDRVFDVAGYEDYIYTRSPQPPLDPDDALWAQALLPL
jgi:hypothetical protein